MIEITSLGQLLSLVNDRSKVTIIDFYADWCGPCQMIKPEYERISAFYDPAQTNFCKCNVDRCRDCAAHYSVRAMPTFVVVVGGEVIERVEGADLGVVQRGIDLAMGQIQRQPAQGSRGGRASGRRVSTGAVQDELAEQMLKVDKARQAKDMIMEKDACDAALAILWKCCAPEHDAKTRNPFGVQLLPYLASDAFSAAATSALFRNVALRGQPQCYEAELMVNQCLRYIIELLSACTWEDMALIRPLQRAVLSLLQVPEAQPMIVRSIYFNDDFVQTGMGLEQRTLLGAFLGLGPFPKGVGMSVSQRNIAEWKALMKMFAPSDKANHAQAVYHVQQKVEVLFSMNHRLVEALLQVRLTRDATLRYLGRALHLNSDYQKTMRQNCPISSRFFMIQLQSVLVEVALPVFSRRPGSDRSFTPSSIPAAYLLEDAEHLNLRSFVNFGKDIERITHFDQANPLPKLPAGTEPFKPSAHLCFLAARALTLCATVFIEDHDRSARSATHPQVPQNQRDAYTAEKCLYEALLQGSRVSESRVQLASGLAQWLLCVMGVKSNGDLPATPPVEWSYLPQQLVDCVIRATQMAPLQVLYLDNLISLMLVLMGNLKYFPKPHTHALFPGFLLRCMQNRDAQRTLENHPWFATRMLRGCIDCYIAVEKCPYERVEVRYELSHCIKSFLKYDSLCDPVREEFRQEGTVLERFSHMAVAEVNESVDQLIGSLTKMNAMVKDGADLSENAAPAASEGGSSNRAPRRQQPSAGQSGQNPAASASSSESDGEEENADGTQSYHQLGIGLRSHIMLFNASMGMFIELSNQFPRGVSQNLVAQQISQMLARSLVAFAGAQSGKLKIEHASRYDFNPREILSTLVDCLTRFRRTSSFLRCLCHGGVSLEDVRGATQTVIERHLVSEELVWKLSEMLSALDSIKQDVDDEEALWDDAPDYALDALLSTPLLQPVALPAEIKDLTDLVYVNKDTIHHLLLSESKHPFTKEFLNEKMVDDFNARAEVAAARATLQASIATWLDSAKEARRKEREAKQRATEQAARDSKKQQKTEASANPADDQDERLWC